MARFPLSSNEIVETKSATMKTILILVLLIKFSASKPEIDDLLCVKEINLFEFSLESRELWAMKCA